MLLIIVAAHQGDWRGHFTTGFDGGFPGNENQLKKADKVA
jgi:hypothetical protein